MRNFINIMERASPIADHKQYFLSPEYIERVVATNRWSDHGSYLDSFIDEVCNGDDADETVRAALREWLPKRLEWIERDLFLMSPDTVINRVIGVTKETFYSISTSDHLSVGIFWGAGDFEPQNSHPILIEFVSTLGGVTVDWRATLESRIDFDNGDHEQEFQLVLGTPVRMTEITTWSENSESIPMDDLLRNATFVA